MKWYKYDIRQLSDSEYNKWYSLMSDEKKHRVDRFRFTNDKKRTVVGEMLARVAVSKWCNIPVENISFGVGDNGKPFVMDLSIEFNISHSKDMVVCAISDAPIGIDIEKIRPKNLKISKRFLSSDELLYIFGKLPTEEDFAVSEDVSVLTRFYECWTKKEAYGKCTGEGLFSQESLSDVAFTTLTEDGYVITICSIK